MSTWLDCYDFLWISCGKVGKIVDKNVISGYNINKNEIIDVFHVFGLPVDEKKGDQLLQFYRMLIEKNKVMNLTAIVDFHQVVYRHFLDSVYGGLLLQTQKEVRLADVGTGAGFPGIPLKICYPQLDMVLADSLNKRICFLEEVISELSLENIRTIHSRAEVLGRDPKYREKFDYVVSRAVADLSVLSEYCIPLVKLGGYFISYKGGNITEELRRAEKAVEILGGVVERVPQFSYECGEIYHRSLVVIRKVKNTGNKFPRKAGIPAKEPIH